MSTRTDFLEAQVAGVAAERDRLETRVAELEAERDKIRRDAALDALFDEAVEAHEHPHQLMSYADYLRYRLGTTGHAYELEGFREVLDRAERAYARAVSDVVEAMRFRGPGNIRTTSKEQASEDMADFIEKWAADRKAGT